MVVRGWGALPAQSAEYVLNDINSGLPAVHVHLSVFLSPFNPQGFGHNDIVFTSRAGRVSIRFNARLIAQTAGPRSKSERTKPLKSSRERSEITVSEQ